jgi:hypothetical protein
VTTSRLLRLQRNAGVTTQQFGSHGGVTAQPSNTVSAGAFETGDCIANETADRLGSAILIGACGAFVALLRKRAEIVLADVDRQPPKPAARPFPVGSHSLGGCHHGGLPLWGIVHGNRSQGLNGPETLNGLAGSPRGYGPIRGVLSGMR